MTTVHLIIIVEKPPAGVDYALQKGTGSKYEIEQKRRSTGADLRFEFDARVEGGDFRGPYVAGPRGGRFIYLDIGTAAGQHDSAWSRRLKIPLTGLIAEPGRSYEARVPGTGRDGSPTCATVKPFGGWNLARPA